ncbi:phage tail protein, partial [Escherichia coli]|uniref:phage tail fiber protein n=1 Tax=Escherichia coli TaxID=562 RepID=UPI003C7941D4
TANTWSARQTFNGGITGALTGNADTATKLKTAININGVRFDGSADITLTPKDLDVYSKSEIDNKKGMRKYTFSAPANAVSGKWYPIVFRRSGGGTDELASRVVITTCSSAGGYAMNNCEFNGFVMPGGWSDRGSYAAGFFSIYSTAERAIHSIISSVKDDDLCSVFYVEARAFPIKIFAEEGLNVIVPTTDYTVGQATYKWGATDPVAESTNTQTILDFKNGRGYYCSHQFVSSLSGNAATATKLASSINIGGVSFDGSADIDLPGVNTKGNQDTTGNAATATKLQTACTINGVSFDGSKNIELTAEDLNLQETVNKAGNAVQKTGDTLSGGLTFENDSILAWIRNTDWAKIGFKNNADSDTDSYMWFETGDNGNEYFKWRSKQSTTTKDLMNLKWDALYVLVNAIVNGEVISKSANGLRIAYGNYGFFIRNDGSNTYFMLTNSGDNMGTYNGLRPLWINNATGAVSMGRGLNVSGETLSDRFAINSSNGMWIQMRDNNAIFGKNIVNTDSAQALLRQNHADRKFMIGGLGNKQFGIYMINNSRTANGTDGQAYMDNNGNWLCGAQIIPGNYGNFDSRYVKDVRLGTRVVQLMARGGRYEKAGHAITGLRIIGEVDGDDEAIFRPIQKYINGTWYNVAQV